MKIIYVKDCEKYVNSPNVKIVYYQDAIFEIFDDRKNKSNIEILFDDDLIENKDDFYIKIIEIILIYKIKVNILCSSNLENSLKKLIQNRKLELIDFANLNNIDTLELLKSKNIFKYLKCNLQYSHDLIKQTNLPIVNLRKNERKNKKEENEIKASEIDAKYSNHELDIFKNKVIKNQPNKLNTCSSEKKLKKVLLFNMNIAEYKNIFNIKFEKYIKVLNKDNIISFLLSNESNLDQFILYSKVSLEDLSYNDELLNILYYINSEFTPLNSNIFINTNKGLEFYILKKILNNFKFFKKEI